MADETFTAEQRDNAVTAALATERGRVADLRKLGNTHGATDAELSAAIDGNVTVAAFAIQMADKTVAAANAAAAAEADRIAAAKAAAEAEEDTRLAALKTDEEAAALAAASPGAEPAAAANAADKLANDIIAAAAAVSGSK
jgi:hypothetical protein